MRMSTRVIRAGLPAPVQGEPFLPGPVFASVYHAAGEPSASPFTYGRFHNPTWSRFEQALGELEGGPVVTFASGMAAVSAVLGVALRPGDLLVVPSDSYYTTRMAADGYFSAMGVRVRGAPTAGNGQLELISGAKLVWLESPSNPGLDVCDLATMISAAHGAGALVAVDNTTATVLGQCPLALGADFSVASDTKALTGHADIVLGHVGCRDRSMAEHLLAWRTQSGAVPGPMEVWLAHRSLGTLDLRLRRQCDNALAIARFVEGRSGVTSVRYPGLPGDPAHPIAVRQMQHFGPVVSFVLRGREQAERCLASCGIITEATSFGGIHSTAERRARWGGDAVPEGFIRLSAGCEDADDLVADLAQALEAAG